MLKSTAIVLALMGNGHAPLPPHGLSSNMVAQQAGGWPLKPSEAAMIAQQSVPGSVVLNVRPLPSGQYVVTLRAGNNVLRVTVDATSGAVN